MIDITQAVKEGKLETIIPYTSNYSIQPCKDELNAFDENNRENQYIQAKAYYIGGETVVKEANTKNPDGFKCYLSNAFEKNTDSYDSVKKVKYNGDNHTLCYCNVKNSYNAGVNAVSLTKVQGKNMPRIFIASGELTGCAFGVLYKENTIYIVHVGKDSNASTSDYTMNEKCRDIFNAVTVMKNENSGKKIQLRTKELPAEGLFEFLAQEGIDGHIYFNKKDLKDSIRKRNSLYFESYQLSTTYDYKKLCGEIRSCNVLFVQNESGQNDISCRGIAMRTTKEGKISYEVAQNVFTNRIV